MICTRKLIASLLLLGLASSGNSLDNGLALTPPMGWLSWQRFLCNTDCKNDPQNCISERLYKDMADRLVADGFKDAGYEFVNIDDCWMAPSRDASGRLVPDPERFPGGIKALADYMHSKGLKLGIYEDTGTKTCAGYPGSKDHYAADAQTFAEWNVDMLKFDGCYTEPKDMDTLYPAMTLALNQTGHPIVFSCEWPLYQIGAGIKPNYTAIAKHCNLWRYFNDIVDSWTSVMSIVDFYGKNQEDLFAVAGPGSWNDPDMLVIGNFGLSNEQSKAQMALWAVMAAPLLMSNDLRNLAPEHRDILLNRDIIAINQDSLGIVGRRIYQENNIEVWLRPVTPVVQGPYSFALVVFNRASIGGPVKFTTTLAKLGVSGSPSYEVTDLFQHKSMGKFLPSDTFTVTVNPSGVIMVRAEAQTDA